MINTFDCFFFFQAEDGIRDAQESRGLGDVYKRQSHTDTEVLLKSYIYWGEECLNRFNGMWAFVIYDTITKYIFGARDRFEIKTLYYYIDKTCFILASDIQSIFKI